MLCDAQGKLKKYYRRKNRKSNVKELKGIEMFGPDFYKLCYFKKIYRC